MVGEGEKVRAVKFHVRASKSVSHEWPPSAAGYENRRAHCQMERQLERVDRPGSTCENRRSRGSPIRAAKTGSENDEAAGSAEKLRLVSQC